MHQTKDQLFTKIKDIITKEEFEKEIKKIKEEYDDLIDEDTAALLIVDEQGRNKESICKIKELEPGKECTVIGKIVEIINSRNFNRKNGSTGRVINLKIEDETGNCSLALWDRDVELVEKKTIQVGSNVKIINAYIKDGYNGIEINVGRWGIIDKDDVTPVQIQQKKTIENNISGTIIDIESSKAFFRDNGDFGFVTNIKIQTDQGLKQVTLWDEKVKEIQKYKKGDKIIITDIDVKQKNGKTEIHLNGKSKIKKI